MSIPVLPGGFEADRDVNAVVRLRLTGSKITCNFASAWTILARGLKDGGAVHSERTTVETVLPTGTDSVPARRVVEAGSPVRNVRPKGVSREGQVTMYTAGTSATESRYLPSQSCRLAVIALSLRVLDELLREYDIKGEWVSKRERYTHLAAYAGMETAEVDQALHQLRKREKIDDGRYRPADAVERPACRGES